jgi:hypothetical protein
MKPTGTSISRRFRRRPLPRSIMLLLTTVLPTATDARQSGGWRRRYPIATEEVVIRLEQSLGVAHDSVSIGIGIAGKGHVEAVMSPTMRAMA